MGVTKNEILAGFKKRGEECPADLREMLDKYITINGALYCRPHRRVRCHVCEIDYRVQNEDETELRRMRGVRPCGDPSLDAASAELTEVVIASVMKAQKKMQEVPQDPNLREWLRKSEDAINLKYGTPAECCQCASCGSTEHLSKCVRCRIVKYCSRECQRKDWKREHKHECIKPTDGTCLRVPDDFPKIQLAVDAAPAGATIHIAPGIYDEEVLISQPVTITQSPSTDNRNVLLKKKITVRGEFACDSKVLVKGLAMERGIIVDTANSRVVIEACEISNPRGDGVLKKSGHLELLDCAIGMCEDGVLNQGGEITLRRCQITNCECDGIFSNGRVTVEDCEITCIGRHGIKSRGGVKRLGTNNNIQPSEWDDAPDMFSMFQQYGFQ